MTATPIPPSQRGSSRAAAMPAIAERRRKSEQRARSTTRQAHVGIVVDIECAAPPAGESVPQVYEREDVVDHAELPQAGLDVGVAEQIASEHRKDRLFHP